MSPKRPRGATMRRRAREAHPPRGTAGWGRPVVRRRTTRRVPRGGAGPRTFGGAGGAGAAAPERGPARPGRDPRSHPLLARELELVPDAAVEALGVRPPHETKRPVRRGDRDSRSHGELQRLAAVGREDPRL